MTARLAAEGVEIVDCIRRDIASMQNGARIVPVVELTAKTDWCHVMSCVKSLVDLAARVHVIHDIEAGPLAAFHAVNPA